MELRQGHIVIGGISAEAIARQFGTPLYVYDAERIRQNFRRLRDAFRSRWPGFQVFYAVKANSNPHVARILTGEGAGLDCASANELRLAERLGLRGERVLFSGNNLEEEDLREGLRSEAVFNLDDLSLLPRLLAQGKPEILSFRINPDYGKSNVHPSDVMAGRDAKFGIPWEKAAQAYAEAKKAGIRRFGAHMMTGSCVTDPVYFETVTRKLLDCVGIIRRSVGIDFEFINIGGGFGIPYAPGEKPLDIETTAEKVTSVFRERAEHHGLGSPRLFVEPGRYFVGDAGFLLGRVHAVKESYRKFAGTDIGMNILARPFIYNAYHHVWVDGKNDTAPLEKVTLTGQACENADAWSGERLLPPLKAGDLVCVGDAGAYGYCMSFPYNGRLRAAEVLVENGNARLIRRRESFEDWLGLVAECTEGQRFLS